MTTAAPQPHGPPPATTASADLIAGYQVRPDAPDTMLGADGRVTDDWSRLAPALRSLPPDALEHRRRHTEQIVEDNGLLLTDTRAWPLNPIPFQIRRPSFATLAAALEQRARLLNTLVADLLGEQRALRDKILPPAILFANPHYHRAYHDLPAGGERYIHMYAADVTRGSDGRWWAWRDLTQAPPGLGFLLENRTASARVHADWFNTLQVVKLTRSLETLRRTLRNLAPRDRRNPRIVVLGRGLDTERGFEDEFLARYLGYTFAEGEDLATRRGQTVLKLLDGPAPVEVVLRRIEDEACDPVELRPDAIDGVAGLVESQRQSQVAIANMLGAQLAEAPALAAFLDPLSRFYFGEDLDLPSGPAWWCGQPTALDHVLANVDTLDVRSAFDASAPAVDARRLTREQRADLIDRIRAAPEQYVGQERPRPGTTPVWNGGRLEAWPWSLRTFAVLDDDQHRTMPGGIVRTVRDADAPPEQTPRAVQDCWVLADGPVDAPAVAPPSDGHVLIMRGGVELPSRIAEHLYWLGRRVEAAENRARLLRALSIRAADDAPAPVAAPSDAPLAAHPWLTMFNLVEGGEIPLTFDAASRRVRRAAVGPPREGGLAGDIAEALRLARLVRDRISIDAWRVLLRADRAMLIATRRADAASVPMDATRLLNDIVLDLSAFAGLMSESMTRTLAWRFLDMGRRLERVTQMSALLQLALGTMRAGERSLLEVALEVGDSIMTYRSRYLAEILAAPALDLLMTDESNPRSIAFQLAVVNEHLDHLPRGGRNAPLEPDQRAALGMLDAVRLADPEQFAAADESGARTKLTELLGRLDADGPIVERALTAQYLVHAALPKQFTAVKTTGEGGGS